MDDTLAGFIQWPRNALKIVNIEAPHKSNIASRKASTYEIETSTSVYIPKFVSPEANEDQQQMPIDTIDLDDSDDFVESLWAIPIVNQILRPQNEESNQEKQARKIKSALNAIKERPAWVQDIVSELEKHVGNYHLNPVPIEFSIPDGMYPYILKDFIEIEALLQVFANGGLISRSYIGLRRSFIRCQMMVKDTTHALSLVQTRSTVRCANVIPKKLKVTFLVYMSFTWTNDTFLHQVFILDSLKGNKDKNNYLLSKVIEDVFKGTKFTWSMVECKQQKGGWECGFMVLGYMMEFVYTYQENFPTNVSILYIPCLLVFMYMYTQLYVCVCLRAFMYMCIDMYRWLYAYGYVCTYVIVCTYSCFI
ncbi:putative papain-like cysteine peptidase superfamily [Helianthus annuus]|nr:putative papain-like cysteine peptidase superfamily [Helianthus annuus]